MKYLLWKDYMMMRSMVWFLFIVYVVTSAMSFREPAGMSSVEAVMGTTLLLSAFDRNDERGQCGDHGIAEREQIFFPYILPP